jgi:hypothetical protein
VLGLLADLPRKNCWTIAEHAGNPSPDGRQHVLGRAVWDHDGVRDDLRAYLVEYLGDPEAVLVVDETGDLKKGVQSVGVQRQYTGTAGPHRERPGRRLPGLRHRLAVTCDHPVVAAGDTYRADALLRRVPARAWQCVSAGRGAKGHRWYDWAFLRLDDGDPSPGGQAGQRWLLVRRNRKTRELAFYDCWTPRPVSLATLVRVAGQRWRIEERFQTGKGLVGLDQHQVRRWRSWYRWATLAMLAHAFLAHAFLVVVALIERTRHPAPPRLIGLTCNEVQHLFAALVAVPVTDTGHRWRWSLWRRRHQARARTCHYQRQAAQQR